jgi:hypothetical protein
MMGPKGVRRHVGFTARLGSWAAAVLHLDGLLSFLTKAARLGWDLPTSQDHILLRTKPRGVSLERYESSLVLPAVTASPAFPGH